MFFFGNSANVGRRALHFGQTCFQLSIFRSLQPGHSLLQRSFDTVFAIRESIVLVEDKLRISER
jgi:hypothetical protein